MESRWRSNLREQHNLLRKNINSWPWSSWALYFVLVPLALLVVPLLPAGILDRFFVLHVYRPTLVSMFLANYTHREIGHLCTNLALYLFTITLVFLFEPDRSRFLRFSLVFFLGLPLVLSMATVTFAGYVPMPPDSEGFSGIVYAFTGYLLYLLLYTLQERIIGTVMARWENLPRFEKIPHVLNFISFVLFVNVVILATGLALGGFQVMERSLANGLAHFTGYILGLLIPALVDACHARDKLPSTVFLLHLMSMTGIYDLILIRIIALS